MEGLGEQIHLCQKQCKKQETSGSYKEERGGQKKNAKEVVTKRIEKQNNLGRKPLGKSEWAISSGPWGVS